MNSADNQNQSALPKYQLVAQELRRDIARGDKRDGDPLQTEEELRKRFSVSRQTVRQALKLLEDDGLLTRRRGSGSYVAHAPRKRYGALSVMVMTTYITDYIFPSIVRGMERELSGAGCLMNLCATYNRSEQEGELLRRMLASPPDGLIVEGTSTALPNPNIELYERLLERNIPIVFINGYYDDLPGAAHVVMDDEGGGRMAARALLNAGRERVCGIFKSDDMQGRLRHRGFIDGLGDSAPKDDMVLWFTTSNRASLLSRDEGRAFIEAAASGANGLVCYNDEIALRALDALQRLGLNVPEDISLISFDNSAYAPISRPRLTSLNHPKEEFGRLAAKKLLGALSGERPQSEVLPWTLIAGESL